MFFESPESPRVLANDYLDILTRVHFLSVPILFVPITIVGLTLSVVQAGVSLAATAARFAVGVLTWPLTEYWLHREFFHWIPRLSWGERMHFWVHGIHHTYPHDPYRLVMPPWINLPLLFLLVAPVALLMAPTWGFGFLAGFVAGYVNYDVTHYFLHHHRPRSAHYKKLRAHHMNHHHNQSGKRYGVSFMFWDRVFGTAE
jgi:sterol desaturase/sphingolipid hydroxylase (fatty acid hydroxylase superfamily)